MKVLLRETVEKLGTIGDVVSVPDGYGRNYLLPKGIALTVTSENIRRLNAKKADLVAAEAQKRSEAESLAGKLKSQTIVIQAKAQGDEGHLYGSVTGASIAAAVSKQGVPCEARMILLDQPIKELGAFDVRIRLFPKVEFEVKVHIVDESLSAGQQAEIVAAQASGERAAAGAEKAPKAKKEKAEGGAEEAPAEGAAEGEKKPRKPKKAKEEPVAGVQLPPGGANAPAPDHSAADNEATLTSRTKGKKK